MSDGLPPGPFDVIYADPPWPYDFSDSNPRAIEAHYPTMSLDAIRALPVREIAAKSSVLFMWTPVPRVLDSTAVMKAWGFQYKTAIGWDKLRIGAGFWVRDRLELLLIGTRGAPKIPAPRRRPDGVIAVAKLRVHSAKPSEFRTLIERMTPWAASRLELFARGRARSGWTFWGDQAIAEPGPGRPRDYHFNADEARRLRAEGRSWRGICDVLHLDRGATRSIRRACGKSPFAGVANPGSHGFATPNGNTRRRSR